MLRIKNENYKQITLGEICKEFENNFYEVFPNSLCVIRNMFEDYTSISSPNCTGIEVSLYFDKKSERHNDIFKNIGCLFLVGKYELGMDNIIPEDAITGYSEKFGTIRDKNRFEVDCDNLNTDFAIRASIDTIMREWRTYVSLIQDELIKLEEEGLLTDEQIEILGME